MTDRSQALDEVLIAPGGSGDLDHVVAVMEAAFDDRFGEAWTRSQCAGILPMPGVELMLARSPDGEPAGFSLFRTVADEAELLLIAVAPAPRYRPPSPRPFPQAGAGGWREQGSS